ncbi:MAG: hypothetical protein OEM28_08040 [Nitrosopumilus sp.]|nr:hypothetical protein [Nitrosopumilus sp.]MDH3488341.1 hypothetical protein [Nitrosopumilus sp.]
MASILFVAIGVAVVTALLGSAVFQFMNTNEDGLSPLEKKCQQIANEGYNIHAIYPAANTEDLPENYMKRILYLDNIWMKECVAVLPADSIIRIANNVERDIMHGE